MKLHESPSPNARRVHVFMAEKGIEMERVPVDIRAGENITPEFLAKNPGGRVPVLELDDGTFIGESVAICRYLEALQGEPDLFGEGALQSAQVEMWQRRVELNFMAEVAGAFRNITGFFKDRETCVESGAASVPKKRQKLWPCSTLNWQTTSISLAINSASLTSPWASPSTSPAR